MFILLAVYWSVWNYDSGDSQCGHHSGYCRPSTAGTPYSAFLGLLRRIRRLHAGQRFILPDSLSAQISLSFNRIQFTLLYW